MQNWEEGTGVGSVVPTANLHLCLTQVKHSHGCPDLWNLSKTSKCNFHQKQAQTIYTTNHSLYLSSNGSPPKWQMYKVSSQSPKYLPSGLSLTKVGKLAKFKASPRNKENQGSKKLTSLKKHSYKVTSIKIPTTWAGTPKILRAISGFFDASFPTSNSESLWFQTRILKILFTLRRKWLNVSLLYQLSSP